MTEAAIPGMRGADALLMIWDEARCAFRPVAGLAGAASGGPVRARPGAAVAGHGIVRDRATARLFERLARQGAITRWLLRDADGGEACGRYRIAAFAAAAVGEYEIPCTLALEPARAEALLETAAA